MRIDLPPERLIEKLNCVHLHAAVGDHVRELEILCKYLRITTDTL